MPSPKPDSKLYLAIDQGGHASRAMIFDYQGQLITEHHCKITTKRPASDRVEHDANEMVSSIARAINNALAQLGDSSRHIVAAGMATQRSNIVCWNRETGAAISPIISWQDRRAREWSQQFTACRDRIHEITGLYPTAHYGFSKLKWCLDNIPEVETARKNGTLAWGPMSSYLCYRLLVERPFVVDPVNASRTLFWDIHSKDWSDELLEMFSLPHGCLPQCVPSTHHFGTVKSGSHSIPMNIVTGDQSAALFANGRLEQDTAYITVGTGAFVLRVTGNQPVTSSRLLSSIVLQNDSGTIYALEGTVNGAASALSWILDKTRLHKEMDKLPEWLLTDCDPPLFLNGVSGLGTPLWRPDFTSSFIGNGDDRHKVVAVIESIVFLLQLNLEEMLVSLTPPKKIVIGGGLSRFDGLCIRLANISGLPVYRLDTHENTALGLAYLVAGCPASWPTRIGNHCFEPSPAPSLASRYTRWKKALMDAV